MAPFCGSDNFDNVKNNNMLIIWRKVVKMLIKNVFDHMLTNITFSYWLNIPKIEKLKACEFDIPTLFYSSTIST